MPSRGASPVRTASPGPRGTPLKKSTPVKGGASAGAAKAGAGKKLPPKKPPNSNDFIASKKWTGAKTGFVFKDGAYGQGYYADALASQRGAPPAAATPAEVLDAEEVFSSLPMSMQVAFEARDIVGLDAALAALPPAEAEEHMRRCIDSGLWDPQGAGGAPAAAGGAADGSHSNNSEQEPSPTGESSPQQSNSASASRRSDDSPSASAEQQSNNPDVSDPTPAAATTVPPASGAPQLFDRGPYKANGASASSDAPASSKRPPIGGSGASAAKGAGAARAKTGGYSGSTGDSELQKQLQFEKAARAAAEAEVDKIQVQVQRLLAKLDAAEQFKSDEARAMTAARENQQRLQAENDVLRRKLAEAGLSLDEAAPATGTGASGDAGAAAAADGGGAGGEGAKGGVQPFDAAKMDSSEVPAISYPPASLDPDVVLASLPESMQVAFDALDVAALHAALAAMPPAEASEYMRRCVACGLWDPNGAGAAAAADGS